MLDFPSPASTGQIYGSWTYDGVKWGPTAGGGGGTSITIADSPPANPTAGALWFDSSGGQLYVWYTDPNTSQWVITNNTGATGVTVGTVPPANPVVGQLWWDSNGALLYVWYNDGTSSQWVVVVNPGGGGGGAGGASITVSDTAPANPAVGALWFDSTGQQLYVWYNDGNSSQWVPASNQAGGNYLPLSGGTTTGPVSLKGVTDGSSAAAGQVGEYVTASGGPYSINSAGTGNTLVSLTLSAGDWEVGGNVNISLSVGNSMIGWQFGIGPTVNTMNSLWQMVQGFGAAIGSTVAPLTPTRLLITASTTVNGNIYVNFSSGTASCSSMLYARRMR